MNKVPDRYRINNLVMIKYMANINSKNEVIKLLISFNKLTSRVMKLKIKDKQALGLLAEAMQINKQMLSLIKDNKISLEFVRQIFAIISVFVKEIVSKWLFRYNLTPAMA